MDYRVHGILQARILKWGSLSFLQGIVPTLGTNPGLMHCRAIRYQLNHKGSPRILEWVAYPFSSSLPGPEIESGSPALQVDSLPAEPQGKPKNTGVGSLSLLTDLLNLGIEPGPPALQADSLPAKLQGKPKNTGVGSFSLLQIFLTQELNGGLLH